MQAEKVPRKVGEPWSTERLQEIWEKAADKLLAMQKDAKKAAKKEKKEAKKRKKEKEDGE
eukprot:gene5593-6274_t